MFKKLRESIERIHWEGAAEPSWWLKFVRGQVKLYFYILRELVRDRCLQQAAALTFTTLLSLVPLFAVAFSLYRSFAGIEGLEDRAQDAVLEFLLAGPLLDQPLLEAEEEAPPGEEFADLPAEELTSRAQSLGRAGDDLGALRLYLAALERGGEAAEIRRQTGLLRLPLGSEQYFRNLSLGGKRRYLEAAGVPELHPGPEGEEQDPDRPSFRQALDSYARGNYQAALQYLAVAERGGCPAAETREIAARAHLRVAADLEGRGEELAARDHYREALAADVDLLVLAGGGGWEEDLTTVLRRHRRARRDLGEMLLEMGTREANLYYSLEDGPEAERQQRLQGAIELLGQSAPLLADSSQADVLLADLLWTEQGTKDEAYARLKLALQKRGTVAARGISVVVADYIRTFVDKVGRANIGILATIFLLVTATSLLSTIEKTLNHIWKVTERRPFWVKFTSFWTLICLGPVMIGATIWAQEHLEQYVTVTVTQVPVLGGVIAVLIAAGRHMVPFLTTWLLLVALYMFLPHTRVKFTSAAWGAFIAAILLTAARPLFGLYVLGAVKYQRIYGSLGAVPVFLLWIWLLWVIALFGAEISFTIQNVGLLRYRDKLSRLSAIFIDRYLAARIVMYVAREFWETGKPLRVDRLAEILQTTPEEAGDAARRLVRLGLLTPVGDQHDEFHPARDLSRLKLSEMLSITDRFRDESRSEQQENRPYEDRLEGVFRSAIQAQEEALDGLTLRDLLDQCEKERDKWPKGHESRHD